MNIAIKFKNYKIKLINSNKINQNHQKNQKKYQLNIRNAKIKFQNYKNHQKSKVKIQMMITIKNNKIN